MLLLVYDASRSRLKSMVAVAFRFLLTSCKFLTGDKRGADESSDRRVGAEQERIMMGIRHELQVTSLDDRN